MDRLQLSAAERRHLEQQRRDTRDARLFRSHLATAVKRSTVSAKPQRTIDSFTFGKPRRHGFHVQAVAVAPAAHREPQFVGSAGRVNAILDLRFGTARRPR
jgi:hypothetical protein